MSTKIYYFSGTGNSFIVAKSLSEKLKAELISIPKIMGTDKIQIDAERIDRDQEVIIKKSKIKVDNICNRILKNKGTRYKAAKIMFMTLMSPMYKMMHQSVINALVEKAKEPLCSILDYHELLPLTDRSIVVDDNCNGCGTCAQICPVKNIEIVDKRPEFKHKCEMCFACDEWCPSKAIHHWSRAEGVKYRHPEVKISDMFM